MRLAKEKFQQLLDEKCAFPLFQYIRMFRAFIRQFLRDKMAKYEISFRFCGNLALLPSDIQKLIAEIEISSSGFTK